MLEGIAGLGVLFIFLLWASFLRITRSKFITWECFAGGFILSAPMALMFLWGFGGLSDSNNTVWIGIMVILFFLALPGSFILLLIGIVAAFSGKTGELVAGACVVLSVANAHLVGMIYYGGLKQDKDQNVDTPSP